MKLPAPPMFSDSEIARETRHGELPPLQAHGRYKAHGADSGPRRTQAKVGLRAHLKRMWQLLTQDPT